MNTRQATPGEGTDFYSTNSPVMRPVARLFLPNHKEAIVCHWSWESTRLLLQPAKSADAEFGSWSLDVAQAELELGGFNEDQVVLKEAGLTLYCQRADIEGELRRLQLRRIQQKLGAEKARVKHQWRMSWVLLACFVMLVAGGAAFTWWGSDRLVEVAARRSPVSWDVELGKLAWKSQMSQTKEVTDPRVVAPVKSMVAEITQPYQGRGFEFEVHVLDSPEMNAFAMPGGQMAIYTGLLKEASGPEEVMGVLAHEVQHVVCRHGMRSIYGGLRWQLLAFVLAGDGTGLHSHLMNSGAFLATLSYGRDMEREADVEGVKLLQARGYDPSGVVKFFKKLDQKQGALEGRLKYLSTHPTSKERIDNLEKLIQGSPKGETMKVDWASLQAALGKGTSVESRGSE